MSRRKPPRGRFYPVSILMPACNEGNHLHRTVESLFENTYYPDFELILVDDASTDGSFDFLARSPYRADPRIQVLRNRSRQGCLQSWIRAAAAAGGEVFKFLDGHHSFSPYWLSNLVGSLARRDFNVLAGPVVSVLEAETWRPTNTLSYGWGVAPDLASAWHLRRDEVGSDGQVHWLSGHQITLHRRIYDEIGGFCPLYRGHGTDDLDLCLRAYRYGYACVVEPSALLGHLYKDRFLEPVTWEELAFNHFLLLHLNLGPAALAQPVEALEYGAAGGLKEFRRRFGEIEAFYDRFLTDTPRPAAALEAALRAAQPAGLTR